MRHPRNPACHAVLAILLAFISPTACGPQSPDTNSGLPEILVFAPIDEPLPDDGAGRVQRDPGGAERGPDLAADGAPGGGCPDNPEKAEPGICGCGLPDVDSDGDLTYDCHDGCPFNASKANTGVCGCNADDGDGDRDQVLDCFDQCPDDPEKVFPGACGCGVPDVDLDRDGIADCTPPCPDGSLRDSDGDGYLDCVDECPDDAKKSQPGLCGCGEADVDRDLNGKIECERECVTSVGDLDGDGVSNCEDDCPEDPGKTDPLFCGCGVAEVDSDGDGIPNCVDQCAGEADADADADGIADCLDACPGSEDGIDADQDGVPDGCDSLISSLRINPASVAFGDALVSQPLQVWNPDGGTIGYTVRDNAAWLRVVPTAGQSSGETDTLTVFVDRIGMVPGPYGATVTVTPTVGTDKTVAVSMTVPEASGGDGGDGDDGGDGEPDPPPDPDPEPDPEPDPDPVPDPTTPPPPPPGSMTTASRTVGMAPLAVFFEAVGSATKVDQPSDGDYAGFRYEWDFGDPASGSWSVSGRSKNTASGYVASHVFDGPGTYRVSLKLTKPSGEVRTYYQDVLAYDFGGKTYYVSSSAGSDGNDGASASTPFKSFAKAMSKLQKNVRILFKRGDNWTIGDGVNVGDDGPGIIGAYGSGNRPRVRMTGTVGDVFEVKGKDWRIMDLELVGPGLIGSSSARGIHRAGDDGLFRNLRVTEFDYGLSNADLPRHRTSIVECSFINNYSYGIFYGSSTNEPPPRNVAIIGCDFDRVVKEHLLRCYVAHSLLAHNAFGRGEEEKSQLKFVGKQSPYKSEFCVISDNAFNDAGPVAWKAGIGPQNGSTDERAENIIFERNYMRASGSTMHFLNVWARRVTVRNNVFDGTGAAGGLVVVNIEKRGIEPTPRDNAVYNNTAYRDDSSSVLFCEIKDAAQNTVVRNNLIAVSSAQIAGSTIVDGPAAVNSDNLLVNKSGVFVNPGGGDFTPSSTSPALNAGERFPGVFEDFLGRSRPNAGVDVGAYERP